MIRDLYELVTGKPWTTGRNITTDYGPPPGQVHRARLAQYTDAELLAHHDIIRASLTVRARVSA